MKTPTMELLELQRHREIKDILNSSMELYRGRRNSDVLIAAALGVSIGTLKNWCRDLEIDVASYRMVRS